MRSGTPYFVFAAVSGLIFSGLAFAAAQSSAPPPLTSAPAVVNEAVPPASDAYPLGPDSMPQPNVPTGVTFSFELTSSTVFPDTTRTITVYIPAQYTGEEPACLYVGFDGLGFHATTVFDNLIAQHAMPVTIGIGVAPGVVASAEHPANPRFDRSLEFDTRSDRLARFLLDEVIPAVEKHSTPDGRPIHISMRAADRAIGGGSTGAIAAFTVAWERPDAFSRVFSSIGTYVGMRGGESYYVMVRKTEPKPLRIFMQDGAHDEWPGGPEMGDWWMSNQTIARALEFAGYDVRHVWGVGTHNGNQAAAVFPDAMRWLWRGWPSAVSAGAPGNPVLKAVLEPGEDWQVAAASCPQSLHLASDRRGKVFRGSATGLHEIGSNTANCGSSEAADGAVALGPDGKARRSTDVASALPSGLSIRDFTIRHNGDIYVTAQTADGSGELWLSRPNAKPIRLDTGLHAPSGLAFSPDGLWLFVAQSTSKFGLSYRVHPDGTLDAREAFYEFAVPSWAEDSGAGQVAMDRDGRAYVATRLGVQIFDRNGRVTAILPLPGNKSATGLSFGGPSFDKLYVASDGKVFVRKLRMASAPPWSAPIVLPGWGPG